MPAVESFDVVILGGGPAGISCSFELKDNFVRHALLERSHELGGQLPQILNRIRNFGGVLFKNGTTLQNSLIKAANELNLPFRLNDEAIAVNLSQKTVKTRHGSMIGKVLVLATGARTRKLEIEQGKHLSSQIIYRTEGKEAQMKGKSAIVVGGSDSALIEAICSAKNAPNVTLICRSSSLNARPDLLKDVQKSKNIEILTDTELQGLVGNERIEAVEVRNSQTGEVRQIAAPLVVAKIGLAPNTELFAGQIKMDKAGHVEVDQHLQTSLPGVFAIGDLTTPYYWRIATAVGQGAIAARSAMEYLRSLDESN